VAVLQQWIGVKVSLVEGRRSAPRPGSLRPSPGIQAGRTPLVSGTAAECEAGEQSPLNSSQVRSGVYLRRLAASSGGFCGCLSPCAGFGSSLWGREWLCFPRGREVNGALEGAKKFSEGVVVCRGLKSCGSGLPWSVAGALSLARWDAGVTAGVVPGKIQSEFCIWALIWPSAGS